MPQTWIKQIGEWNPQLFRELKGNFTPWKFWFTVCLSLLAQFVLLPSFAEKKCISQSLNTCLQSAWQIQWSFVFNFLNWSLPLLLLTSGVYMLISDMAQEERRGTLNFIRLSPQSSQSILIGKMLGVPALIHLGIALAVPLHLGAGLAAGLPLIWLWGIYLLWIAGGYLFYSFALLSSLHPNPQIEPKSLAGAGGLIAFLLSLPYISILNFSVNWYQPDLPLKAWFWFSFPLGKQPELAYGWFLTSVIIAGYWGWQAINRRFRNPKATLISKSQSYWLVSSLQIWFLGLALPELNSFQPDLFLGIGLLFFLNPLFFLILSVSLSPHRQDLLDWARYRREGNSTRRKFWNSYLAKDLIGAEKSPAVAAMAINLLITGVIWIPWVLLAHQVVPNSVKLHQMFLGWLSTLIVTLIYTVVITLFRLSKIQNRFLIAIILGFMVGVILLPVASLYLLGNEQLAALLFSLFLPLPFSTFLLGSTTTILFSLLAQLGVLSLLSWQLNRQLQKAGESTSKALLHP